MLQSPDSKQSPLKDALKEAFRHTPEEPVISFVHAGLRSLREEANKARADKGIELKEEY